MTTGTTQSTQPPGQMSSPWAPFRHTAFTLLWIATVVANVGTWMYNAASGWLMTSLDPDPLIVSLVQVANTLPIFLLALPAGALADVVDRRRFLFWNEAAITALSAVFAAFVALDLVTAHLLLLFTFLIGIGGALTAPAWQAIVPQLVSKGDLAPAISANSVGFNISRAIGPALGGAAIAWSGIAAPFWINVISNLGVLGVLWWWRSPQRSEARLPAERVSNAVVTGIRYARYNAHLRATLMRAVGFFLFGSAYWALLPLVARNQIAGGPELYGIMLGVIGVGAVTGAFILPWLKQMLGPDWVVAAGTVGTAVALILFGLARDTLTGLLASFIAGTCWIVVLATLNVSAQIALPEWVRGRGLAVYMTVFFGGLSLGSMIWGKAAGVIGLAPAHFAAATAALVVVPLTWRWKLQTGAGFDLTPSMHWPAPITAREIEHDRGPVLVSVEYRIDPRDRNTFLAAHSRKADPRRAGRNSHIRLALLCECRKVRTATIAQRSRGHRYLGRPNASQESLIVTEISSALAALQQQLQASSLQTIRASDVIQKHVEWLWFNRVARGKLTLLAGDPGLGKSQIGIDIAARLTTAKAWPDGSTAPPGSCIILASEDAANDTICPRLELAGADLTKVHIVQAVTEKNEQRGFSLQCDLEALTAKTKEIGDAIFVSIDPITAYLGNDIDSHRTSDVRSVLARLERFADEQRIATLGITHPPKAAQAKAINAFTGSLAFVAAARLAFVAIEEAETDRHLLLSVKNNLGPKADGIGYRMEQGATPQGIITSRIVWDNQPVTVTANEALAAAQESRKGEAGREAEAFLEGYLEAQPMPAAKVEAAAKENGISARTLRRAREKLGIVVEKSSYEGGWVWRLPR